MVNFCGQEWLEIPSARGFSLMGKGSINKKLLGVQASSDFELKVNLKKGEPLEVVSFLVDSGNLTKTAGIEKFFPAFLPDKEILKFSTSY